jgi:CRP-like cAMP-binding protein
MNQRSRAESYSPLGNHLLAALPAADLARLSPEMEFIALALGETLYESGSQLRHVYFPVSGVVSLLIVTEHGGSAEIAVIGNDGCVGMALLLGGETTLDRAVVQIAGHAYRLPAQVVLREFKRGAAAQLLLLRYIQVLMTQTAQTAVCNRHHTVEQQLCRWLLLTLDRVTSRDVAMTQELISNMLGVRRPGVTQAARNLQQAGLIEYERGHIRVLDRAKLEAHACECYAVVKKETDRLLPGAPE